MLSKLVAGQYRMALNCSMVQRRRAQSLRFPFVQRRVYSGIMPPSQYDEPWPKKFNLIYASTHHWELLPLFAVTAVAIFGVIFNVIWACFNKVDVVFLSRDQGNISRTMNLRDPSVHKLILIYQRYEPWPEMQNSLDQMNAAERRLRARLRQECIAELPHVPHP